MCNPGHFTAARVPLALTFFHGGCNRAEESHQANFSQEGLLESNPSLDSCLVSESKVGVDTVVWWSVPNSQYGNNPGWVTLHTREVAGFLLASLSSILWFPYRSRKGKHEPEKASSRLPLQMAIFNLRPDYDFTLRGLHGKPIFLWNPKCPLKKCPLKSTLNCV